MTRRVTESAFHGLGTVAEIQRFLDRLDYDAVPGTRSPLWVKKEKKANCFEGALFAAAALRGLGHPPLVVDMGAVNDDDHVIAVYRKNGHWGSLAKSNFSYLRSREPIYRTIRELALSYFELYINSLGEKTLRSFSLPLNLARFDHRNWMATDEDLDYIGDALDASRHFRLISPVMARNLKNVDGILYRSAFLGTKKEGLYKAK